MKDNNRHSYDNHRISINKAKANYKK
ncbi:hypothetical protein [Clostridium puniceum]